MKCDHKFLGSSNTGETKSQNSYLYGHNFKVFGSEPQLRYDQVKHRKLGT